MNIHVLVGLLLVAYVCLMSLALLNIVTGIFVNDSIEAAQMNQELAAQVERCKVEAVAGQLHDMFLELDTDDSGTLTADEFAGYLANPAVCQLFAALGLDSGDPLAMFQALDLDDSQELDIQEFVMGCIALRGGAKALDLATLAKENKKIVRRIRECSKSTHERLELLQLELSNLRVDQSMSLRSTSAAHVRQDFDI